MKKAKRSRTAPAVDRPTPVPIGTSPADAVSKMPKVDDKRPKIEPVPYREVPPSPVPTTTLIERLWAIFNFRTEREVTNAIEGKPSELPSLSSLPSPKTVALFFGLLVVAGVALRYCS